MAFDFPASPSVGQQFTPVVGTTYTWNGYGWATAPSVSVGFSTGDVKFTLKAVADTGWVMFNDGAIGSATSGAGYANVDAQPLFNLLFANTTDVNCPIFTSAGAATTRAAQTNAATAWANNCRLALPLMLGRALAVAGLGSGLTNHNLGNTLGQESQTLTIGHLVAHSHTITIGDSNLIGAPGAGATLNAAGGQGYSLIGPPAAVAAGGGAAFSIQQPTTFLNVMVKL